MAAALGAMHAEPGRRWTLQALAGRADMSRWSFAQAFKATVGSSPMGYLTRWRMLLAGDRLAGGAETVSAIAASLGYESESAFSTAFRRVMGARLGAARGHRPRPGRTRRRSASAGRGPPDGRPRRHMLPPARVRPTVTGAGCPADAPP